jgi:hypothetical protein
MKWVTRENAKVDRIACPWLIKNFIDKDAEFIFVPRDKVLEVAKKEGALSFDAPGAEYTHREVSGVEKCSFEVLVEHYKINDEAVRKLAKVVHGADVSEDLNVTAESAGLVALADGFRLISSDDHENMKKQFPAYDALYAHFKHKNK